MVNTPYTRWTGDTLHGKRRILTSVWVRLAAICIRAPDAPLETVVTGLDMTGEVPGRLHGWFRTVKGDWLGVVDYEIPYADGRRDTVHLVDQLVPEYALRRRE